MAGIFGADFGLCSWSQNSDHASSLRKGIEKQKMNSKTQAITSSLRISFFLFLVGILASWLFLGGDFSLWFGIGGGIGLLNFMLGAVFVRYGLKNLKKSGVFLSFLLIKSLAFVGIVAFVLMISKPALLAFTLGISLVIFGPVIWALWESRRYLKVVRKNQHGI